MSAAAVGPHGAAVDKRLGNKFLTHIREVDAIVQVVRCFDDADIHHVAGSVDPVRDIETITTELVLSDLEAVQKRLASVAKDAKRFIGARLLGGYGDCRGSLNEIEPAQVHFLLCRESDKPLRECADGLFVISLVRVGRSRWNVHRG